MKNNIKKIIAKEFLFLFGTVIQFILVLFVWTLLNNLNHDKEYELKQKIEKLTKYENLSFRLKLFYYLKNEVTDEFGIKYNHGEKDIFISNLKDNKKALKVYDLLKENGNIRINQEEYLSRISKDIESEKHLNKVSSLEKELEKTKDSFFNDCVCDDKILRFGQILFSLFFLLRYLIYGTKWSIKQLKE